MADGGIGEAALLDAALSSAGTGAAIGGGLSLLTGGDPLEGALMGGLTGGAFGGAGAAFSDVPAGVDAFTAQTSTGLPTVAADATGSSQALTGLQEPSVYSQSTNYQDFGTPSPYAGSSTNGIVGSTGGENVLQNQLGGGMPSGAEPVSATGMGGAGTSYTVEPTAGAATTAANTSPGIGGLMDKAGNFISDNKYELGGAAGLAYLMNQERKKYGVPPVEKYSGPLSKFSYNPLTYKPDVVSPPSPLYRAQYAGGGPVEQMSNENSIGANTGFPQAYLHNAAYATPYQMPISQNVLSGPSDTNVDPFTGEEKMAAGGIASLGSYSDGGRMLKGPGDGMSDSIPATIGKKQPARLADSEFVVPADVVSHLGNGSTDAGAKQLYHMMDRVRQARTGRKAQGREINPMKYMPA